MRAPAALLLFLALAASPASGANLPFLDLDFEAPYCSGGWVLQGRGYESAADTAEVQSGRQSLRIRQWSAQLSSGTIGVAGQQFPAKAVAGKRVRFSGAIKTEGVSGAARLWWVAWDAASNAVASDNMAGRGATGTTPWTRHEIELDVPRNAVRISFGVYQEGWGTSWFDGLAIEVDGRRAVEGRQPVTAPSPAALSWLRKRAIPFATAEPGSGVDDLQRLKKVIGNARIVSLGEGTHGTREFFQMKHRMVEFLAEEMGFTLFAIEATMPEAYRINEYVLTGQGDPAALIEGMHFWTWDTQEVLDMVLWMREWNASGRGRIQFLGFDAQHPHLAADNATAFLQTVDPGYVGEAGAAFAKVEAVDARGQSAFGTEEAREAERAAQAVVDHMQGRRGDYLARFSAREVDWAIQNARVVLQVAQGFSGSQSRDASMAKNVEWILGQEPGAKIVLWAHNAHVHKVPGFMGGELARRFGKDMVVMGFTFAEGRYTAVGEDGLTDRNEALPPPPGTVEAYLRSTGIPRFVVDLRKIPNKAPSATWFKNLRPFRSIGSIAKQCSFEPSVVAEEYDALIWIEETNPSVLLR